MLYADFECWLIKEQSCQNNPEKYYTERKARHEPSVYSLSLICLTRQKISTVYIEEKVVSDIFVEN